VRAFEPRPHRRRVGDGMLGEHALGILAQPFAAPQPAELGVEVFPSCEQMANVVERVTQRGVR